MSPTSLLATEGPVAGFNASTINRRGGEQGD
jgi:hypothetical protein